MSFGDRLEELLKEKHITHEELAKKIGVTRGAVSNWARGDRFPKEEDFIRKIAEVLGVTEQDLFDPEKKERIAKEELQKNPAKFLQFLSEAKHLENVVIAEVMSVKAAGGTGNNVISIDNFSTGEEALIDARFFKTKPPKKIKAMQVDGYSMIPMLYPDSWVLYRDCFEFETDGLYVLNYNNELMVKLLQINPEDGKLEIISVNKDYKSYKIDPMDQSVFMIVGKVLRCII